MIWLDSGPYMLILIGCLFIAIWFAIDLRSRTSKPKRAYKPRSVKTLGGDLLRPKDVSKILGIPLSTLCGMREKGLGPAWFRDGKPIYYKRAEVLRWMREREEIECGVPAAQMGLNGVLNSAEDTATRQRDNSEFAT